MNLILDTHAFAWYATGDQKFPPPLRATVRDPENEVSVSIISLWKIAIKATLGKWPGAPGTHALEARATLHSIAILPVSITAIHETTLLDLVHRDPFYRI